MQNMMPATILRFLSTSMFSSESKKKIREESVNRKLLLSDEIWTTILIWMSKFKKLLIWSKLCNENLYEKMNYGGGRLSDNYLGLKSLSLLIFLRTISKRENKILLGIFVWYQICLLQVHHIVANQKIPFKSVQSIYQKRNLLW